MTVSGGGGWLSASDIVGSHPLSPGHAQHKGYGHMQDNLCSHGTSRLLGRRVHIKDEELCGGDEAGMGVWVGGQTLGLDHSAGEGIVARLGCARDGL